MGNVFKTLYPKVAEIEIEKGRKKDTFPGIRYKAEGSTRLAYTIIQEENSFFIGLQRVTGNVSTRSFLFSTFSISLCTWTVQSGSVPHVTFLVQKLLGEMEKCGKEKT